MTAGLPAAVPASIWPNALVNMNAWYCSTPSSSQMPGQAELQRAPGVGPSRGLGLGAQPAPPRGTAARDGDFTHRALLSYAAVMPQ